MRNNDLKYRSPSMPIAGFLIISIATVAAQQLASASGPGGPTIEAQYLARNTIAMNKMMVGMADKLSGNVDHDFVATMIPHHQGAIDMAQIELVFGHNEQLTRLAHEIIVEQLQEISAMHSAIDESPLPKPGKNRELAGSRGNTAPSASLANESLFLAENKTAMDIMMAGMQAPPTGDVDHDFVATMVPHHRGAVDMAQLEMRYGSDAALKRIAQEIITDQPQEIAMMRLALGETLSPSLSSPSQSAQQARGTVAVAPNSNQMSPAIHVASAMQMPSTKNIEQPPSSTGN
ncbi:DUF305 domain-containing protein [Rhodanobacter sp. MP7CTX1]|uniref:DUF305 domain-containing protein n=1 Tax=Rhodanobacter sp. MP7CTX1 TaxID=2723084 RepID=UPI00184E9025|nr:DUF305 domain-containing protein [Rhodanobacter sp. MP7CTX1]MBB6187620.1 uncharacterized protein (DUF305 family) [Rhodanobacter sp. MP7CTX1]